MIGFADVSFDVIFVTFIVWIGTVIFVKVLFGLVF